MTTPPGIPPGWYDDGHGATRWWDGVAWSADVLPATPLGPPIDTSRQAGRRKRERRSRWPFAVAGLVVLAVVASAVAVSLLLLSGTDADPAVATDAIVEPTTTSVTVSFLLIDEESASSGCTSGSGGYSDISPGAPVTIEDETGKILASDFLEAGTTASTGTACLFSVTLDDVPTTAAQYGTTIGRRGTVTYDRARLEENNWNVDLSIGD